MFLCADNLARHFFEMPFQASRLYQRDARRAVIADLMPKYPIYVTLLSQEARDVIGVVNDIQNPLGSAQPQGFHLCGLWDLFDPPGWGADRDRIATVQHSYTQVVNARNYRGNRGHPRDDCQYADGEFSDYTRHNPPRCR